jgi:hypothetical protein
MIRITLGDAPGIAVRSSAVVVLAGLAMALSQDVAVAKPSHADHHGTPAATHPAAVHPKPAALPTSVALPQPAAAHPTAGLPPGLIEGAVALVGDTAVVGAEGFVVKTLSAEEAFEQRIAKAQAERDAILNADLEKPGLSESALATYQRLITELSVREQENKSHLDAIHAVLLEAVTAYDDVVTLQNLRVANELKLLQDIRW